MSSKPPAGLEELDGARVQDAPRLGPDHSPSDGQRRSGGSGLQAWRNLVRGNAFEIVLFIVYVVMTSAAAMFRHAAFLTGFDLAVFDQAIWNTAHGDFLYSSLKGGIPVLGDHFSPFLGFLAPLFYIWDDVRILLVVQSLAMGSGIFFASALARERLGRRWLGWVFAAAFFLYLPSRRMLTYDFHPEAFADPLILAAFYLLSRRRLVGFVACLTLVALTKESMNFVLVSAGVYVAFAHRRRALGLALAAAGAALFCLEVFWWIPAINGAPYNYFGTYGQSFSELTTRLFSRDSLTYLKRIFQPVAGLCLLGWGELAMAAPFFAQNLLSENWIHRRIGYHYTAALNAFVFIAAIGGFRRLLAWWKARHAAGILAALLLVCSVLRSGFPEFKEWREWRKPQAIHRRFQAGVLSEIPVQASLRASEHLAVHLAHRKNLHFFENENPREGGSADALTAEVVLVEDGLVQDLINHRIADGFKWKSLAMVYDELRANGYREVKQDGTLRLFKRVQSP